MSEIRDKDAQRALRGGIANYLAAAFQLSIFAFHVLLARLFGQVAYGAYMFSWSIVEVACKVGIVGMDKGMLRGVAAARATGNALKEVEVVATGLKVVVLASVLVIAFLWLLAASQGDEIHGSALFTLAPVVATWSLGLVLVAATMATGTMKYNLAVRGVAEPLFMVGGALGIGLAFKRTGEVGAAGAHLVASTLTFAFAFWAFSRCFSVKNFFEALTRKSIDKHLVLFALPVMLAEILNQAIYRVDIMALGTFQRDPRIVASYGAAVVISSVISSLRYAFDPVLSPIISESVALGDVGRVKENLARMTRWVVFLAIPTFGSIVIFGDILLGFWGPEFAKAHGCLVLLACAHLINATLGLHQWPVVMSGRSRLDLLNNLAGFIVVVTLNVLLTPQFSALGAAVSTLGGNITFRVLQVIQVRHFFRATAFDKAFMKTLLAGILGVASQLLVSVLFVERSVLTFVFGSLAGMAVTFLCGCWWGLIPGPGSLARRLWKKR